MAGRSVSHVGRREVRLRVWGAAAADAEEAEQLARTSEAAQQWTITEVDLVVAARCPIPRRDPDALAWSARHRQAWAAYPAEADATHLGQDDSSP